MRTVKKYPTRFVHGSTELLKKGAQIEFGPFLVWLIGFKISYRAQSLFLGMWDAIWWAVEKKV
jgi:hypothetical protein